ncbi:hypothetical protein [Streptomyces sp. NPDC051132]|uniref:hypothetical protein n=1 Tax=unclassified Streptomyces TaxID=2593676 RepID=UPI0034127268
MNTRTRTRSDSRRGRRELREAERTARREGLRLLLAHTDRRVLTPEDCAALRGHIEDEVVECDTFRRSADGQQVAAMRLHRTLAAADEGLVKTEADRDRYAAAARR